MAVVDEESRTQRVVDDNLKGSKIENILGSLSTLNNRQFRRFGWRESGVYVGECLSHIWTPGLFCCWVCGGNECDGEFGFGVLW